MSPFNDSPTQYLLNQVKPDFSCSTSEDVLNDIEMLQSLNEVNDADNNFPPSQPRPRYTGHIKTQYKPTETFQYKHITSCHTPGIKKMV